MEQRGGFGPGEMDAGAQVARILKAAKRSGGRLVLFGSVGLILGAFAAALVPDLYKSRTLIALRERQMLEDSALWNQIMDRPLEAKESALAEELRSFAFINEVLRRSDWPEYEAIQLRFEKVDRTAPADLLELVDKVRDAKRWKVAMQTANSGELLVTLEFKWYDPQKAYRFVGEARRYWISKRDEDYKKYWNFKLQEAERALQNLKNDYEKAGQALREFQEDNQIAPLTTDNFDAKLMYEQRVELGSVQRTIVELTEKVHLLEEQKAKTPDKIELSTKQTNPQYDAAKQAYEREESALNKLLETLTEVNPKVKEQREKTTKAKKALDALKNDKLSETSTTEAPNPEYEKIVQELTPLDSTLAGLREKGQALEMSISELQTKLDRQPLLEETLNRLTNEFQVTQESLTEARLGIVPIQQKVEKWSGGATGMYRDPEAALEASGAFQLLEEPVVPKETEGLPKFVIALIGLLAGLAAGFALTFAQEMTRGTFEEAKEVQTALQLPVLASISTIQTAQERARARVRALVGAAGSVLLVGALATFVALAIQWPEKLPHGMQQHLKNLKNLFQ